MTLPSTLFAAIFATAPGPSSDTSNATQAAPGPAAAAAAPEPSRPTRVHAYIGVQEAEPQPRGIRGIAVSSTVLLGTGVSMAPGPTRAQINRSPALLTLDAGFSHPELQWLELSPAMMVEMERGVSFGLAFRARAFVPLGRIRPYAVAGLPFFVAPRTLLGARAALGIAAQLHRHFAVAAEFGPTVFFAGNDLAAGGTLTKLDGSAGIRVSF